MRADRKPLRRGGILVEEFEQRVLDGDVKAMRALVRQATGPNTLELTTERPEWREVANGTGGSRLQFNGYASIIEAPFEMMDWLGPYTEVMRAGAFTKTLAENPDVIFCINHDWDAIPMARTLAGTLQLSEDSTGLPVSAQLDGSRADVYALRSAMDAGELDAMSFAFWVTRQVWSPDFEQRDILEVDMDGGDVSEVTWPANPGTWGTTSLRKAQGRALLRTRVPALIAQRASVERREGKTLSASTLDTLQEVLDLIAAADVAVDAAQPLLAELMGVPNPDDDDQEPDGDDMPMDDDDMGDQMSEESKSAPGNADLVRARLALRARAVA